MTKKFLFIPPAEKNYLEILAEEHGVCTATVRRALRDGTYTRQAEAIRYSYYLKYIKPYLQSDDEL